MDYNLHSIPYDIANSMFETSKGLLRNDYLNENDLTNTDALLVNSIRNQASWTMLNALLYLESNWVKSKLKDIFNLWQDALGTQRKENKN